MGRFNDYTSMGGDIWHFQTTIWPLIDAVGGSDGDKRDAALEQLIILYWKPVYCYLRRRGYNDSDAKDVTQDFFTLGLEKELGKKEDEEKEEKEKKEQKKGIFRQADPTRGRFRTFLLRCLSNFIINYERDKKAKGKQPSKPIVSIDQFDTTEIGIELFHTETPEESFNRAWVYQLLLRVLDLLKEECMETEKEQHFELFVRRVIDPILEGGPQPLVKELADELDLPTKKASNYIVTARRAYHRLLRQEICKYASTDEEIALEIEDLFKFVAGESQSFNTTPARDDPCHCGSGKKYKDCCGKKDDSSAVNK